MNRVRCFVAAPLPGAVLPAPEALQVRLRGRGVDARWADPSAVHLTLAFLGELAPAAFARVQEALAPPPAEVVLYESRLGPGGPTYTPHLQTALT